MKMMRKGVDGGDDTSRQKGGKPWNVTQNRDGGMGGRRKTEQQATGMECALSLFRFQVTWHQPLPLSKPLFLDS